MDTLPTKGGPSTAPLSLKQKNTVILGMLMALLLAALDQTIVAPAMPTIVRSLGHAEYLPWIVTAYLLTATASAPLYGKLSDIYGRRPVIYAALGIFLLGSVACALAPSMLALVLARALQGLGGGGIFALVQTVIGDLVPPRERARYVSWISLTWATASIMGPALGGAFAEHLHWSLIFWVNLPFGLVAMAVLNNPLKKLPFRGKPHRLDISGAMLLIVSTSLLLLVLTWGGSLHAWSSFEILGLLGLSATFWAAFALRLMHAREPLVSLAVLGNPVVLGTSSVMFIMHGCNLGLSVYLPIYLQSFQGLSASESGFALLGLLLGGVVGANLTARLIARVEHYKNLAVYGIIASVISFTLLGVFASTRSILLVQILTVGGGIGLGMTFPIGPISVQNAVDQSHLGVATGVLTFLRTLGGAFGVAALGAVALGYGVPLAAEGASGTRVESLTAEPFAMIFFMAAAALAVACAILWATPEKPLRGAGDMPGPQPD